MPHAAAIMPPRAPLPMPGQSFAKAPSGERANAWSGGMLWRAAAFLPSVVLTIVVSGAVASYLWQGGVLVIEALVLAVFALAMIWLAFSVNTTCLGMMRMRLRPALPKRAAGPSTIALLMPIYNETPWDVFGNAAAMLHALQSAPELDRYHLFILSDTQDPAIAELEERAFAALGAHDAYYRRRAQNTDKKIGNITDWIENWGAAYDAMVVLDADSLMSGAAIRQLVAALAADPTAGLIQSRPVLIGARTLFGRVQQFSNAVYGWLVAEGLESWSQREGNYWGHNAIIRTRAFAESARLPHLSGWRGRSHLVLSHDFVEAGMLRRAGWGVRMLPRVTGSYEETPQTLIDYILRDRRWCHGNMQHLRLLSARGFHAISRFHLFYGALAFLMSPVWLAVVILWAFLGQAGPVPESYFSPTNPLMPIWPEAAQQIGWAFLLITFAMLLFPKIMAALLFGLRPRTQAAYRSRGVYVGSICLELVLSTLFAPILMVHHTLAAFYALLGRKAIWAPQNRGAAGYSWGAVMRFHWIETLVGMALIGGMIWTQVPLLVLPIALSLAAAPILSKLSALPVAEAPFRMLRLDTPHTLLEPRIVSAARRERALLKAALSDPPAIAAE